MKVDSLVEGTIGHLGKGILSSVGGPNAHSRAIDGDRTVLINGSPCVRHLDQFEMNLPEGS